MNPIKASKHFDNPAYGRGIQKSAEIDNAKSGMPIAKGTGSPPHGHPPAHKVEIIKHTGGFHTFAHHEQGVHSADHASFDEAATHAKGAMGEGEEAPAMGGMMEGAQ